MTQSGSLLSAAGAHPRGGRSAPAAARAARRQGAAPLGRPARPRWRRSAWRSPSGRASTLPTPASSSSRSASGSRALGITYRLGVDGISLLLVLLTDPAQPLVMLSSWKLHRRAGQGLRRRACCCSRPACSGAFLAPDLFLFYVFWELMLVPMYFIIGVWGGERRIYAAVKFFLFTMAGSLLMLVAILYLGSLHQRVDGRGVVVRLRGHRASWPYPRAEGFWHNPQMLALRRLRARLRHQGADVPAAHLAARRPRRGADRRLGHPGRRAAQARHLRLPALLPAALPRGVGRPRRRCS